MSTVLTDFWWRCFYRCKHEKSETEMKSLLFKGELSEEEFDKLKSSARMADLAGDDCDNRGFVYYISYNELFKSCPQLVDRCNWNMLDDLSWSLLLIEQPQFADKCNKWDEFTGITWSELLSQQPQFADKCDEGFLWCLNVYQWVDLLAKQPQFADRCSEWIYFDAYQWRSLLAEQPQFVDKCTKSSVVVNVLIKHPQFIEYCNTSFITEKGKAKLLAKHPDLAKYFPEAMKKADYDQPELF